MAPAEFGDRQASIRFPQEANDLFISETFFISNLLSVGLNSKVSYPSNPGERRRIPGKRHQVSRLKCIKP